MKLFSHNQALTSERFRFVVLEIRFKNNLHFLQFVDSEAL